MHALHQEILAPSGVEFAAWVKLTVNEGVQSNLVVARSNLLRIFEVREEKFFHVRTHRLHGIVTGLEGVKVLGSLEDGRDRLLVGFKDAKVRLNPSLRKIYSLSSRLLYWNGPTLYTILQRFPFTRMSEHRNA